MLACILGNIIGLLLGSIISIAIILIDEKS